MKKQFFFLVVCLARIVDSVATAQSLKGCTVIQGILEIQIRGGSKLIHFRGHEIGSLPGHVTSGSCDLQNGV